MFLNKMKLACKVPKVMLSTFLELSTLWSVGFFKVGFYFNFKKTHLTHLTR